MKHYVWLSILLCSPLALAQGVPARSPAQPAANRAAMAQPRPPQEADDVAAPKVPIAQVPLSAAVITVQGLCTSPAATGAHQAAASKGTGKTAAATSGDCKTVITRAQFEKLADALNPQMPLPTKRQLAEAYPRLLLFAQKARERGVEKDPRFREMMQFATLQLLAQNLTRDIQQKSGEIPDTTVAQFYKDNPSKFEEVELLRIFIPKSKQHLPATGSTTSPKADTAADEAAMKTEAEKIHSDAAAGGDFQALQKEAFAAAGIKSESPSVNLGKITREGLPTNHQQVFDLQAGQVSSLLDDPGGYYVYKVVSKQLVPLDQAKGEIHNFLQQQAFQKEMQALVGSVKPELNQDYFGGQKSARPAGQGAPKSHQPSSGAKPEAPPKHK